METNTSAEMGQPAAYQMLGKKTLWLFILDRIKVSVIFLFIGIVLFILNGQSFLANVPYVGDAHGMVMAAGWGAMAIALVAFLVAFIASWFVYRNYTYCLDDDALKIRRGALAKEEIAIPYRQIQDINIERPITYQSLGMSRLVILTAGHEDEPHPEGESEGILPALDKDLAERLQAELLKRTNVQHVIEDKQGAEV